MIKSLIKNIFNKKSKSKTNAKYTEDIPQIEAPEDFLGFHYMSMFPHYDRAIPRLLHIFKEKYSTPPEKSPSLCLIDIGANIGDTIAIIRREHKCPILAVEGDIKYFLYLEKNTHNDPSIEIIHTFLGETDSELAMESYHHGGSAYLQQSQNTTNIQSLDTVLENNELFLNAKILKIDTDGFDNIVLRGAKQYLTQTKPIIFMEYAPDYIIGQNEKGVDIFPYLFSLGYKNALMYENYGGYMFPFSLDNTLFIEDMHSYFIKNDRVNFADLCIFHEEDNDLFLKSRQREHDFFAKYKSNH